MLGVKPEFINQLVTTNNLNFEITDFVKSENIGQVVVFTQEKVKSSPSWISDISEKIVVLNDGEKAKDISSVIKSINYLAQIKADQNTLLIAFGGGSVSDHVGFVASIFKRGIRYINIPTTLIGMIDASIGGKTAINIDSLKNQIGTFYHPSKIFIDINLIDIMPDSVINDGLGEMFKYAILDGKEMMDTFQEYLDSRDRDLLNSLILRCCNFKLNVISIDEKDRGLRKTLNLGHTFGHAIEKHFSDKDLLLHGEAISIGMAYAAKFSSSHGELPQKECEEIINLLKYYGLPTSLEDIEGNISQEEIMTLMKHDKKRNNEKNTLILLKEIGKAYINSNIDDKDLVNFFDQEKIK